VNQVIFIDRLVVIARSKILCSSSVGFFREKNIFGWKNEESENKDNIETQMITKQRKQTRELV